jgi:Transcriptional regulatory protein, C terminal
VHRRHNRDVFTGVATPKYCDRVLRVLGPLMVEGPDGPVSVGGPVPRRVLCALLVRPGAVVPVDGLIDAAWGDKPPASAERTLVSHITRLREALVAADAAGAARLERQDGGYRLVVAPDAVDAARLEQVISGGGLTAAVSTCTAARARGGRSNNQVVPCDGRPEGWAIARRTISRAAAVAASVRTPAGTGLRATAQATSRASGHARLPGCIG